MKYDDNLTAKLPSFVTHLECAFTGERYDADQVHNLSRAGKPLLVRYDLDGVRKALSKDKLAARAPDLWRYRELLPVRKPEDIVSLGEAMTPIVRMPRLAAKLGGGEILVKDEGRLPTGSFKARGLVMAVSMAKALGIKHMAMPTNGNAGAALAAYATRAGIKTTIFCPEDTPEVNVSEIALQGATRLSRQRPDRRLRQDRRRGQGQGRLVRHLDPEGAVPDRGQEDDGPRACRAARLAGARRDLLSDRRRHRPDRHVEGVRRAGSDRLHRQEAPAHGRGAGRRLRADGAGLRGRRGARAALGERAHHRLRHPRAAGDRRFSHPARGARERRLRHRGADEAISAALDEVAREEGLSAVPGGRGDLCRLQAEPCRRPGRSAPIRWCCSTARAG